MKTYYKFVIPLAVLIFLVIFAVVGIGSCTNGRKTQKAAAEAAETTVTLRYYSDERDTSRVVFLRVKAGEYFSITEIPECYANSTRVFLGLCDVNGNMLVDANGNSLAPAGGDMLLYPKFQ